MQLLDSAAILAASTLCCFICSFRSKGTWLYGITSFVGVCVVLHLVIEGFRWQMVPAYAALLIVAAPTRLHLMRAKTLELPSRKTRIGIRSCAAVALLFIALTGVLSYAFPVFNVPEPSGSFAVGTTELHLVDESRPETYTDDAYDRRELMVRVWYPAADTAGFAQDTYWRDAIARSTAVTRSTPVPWFTFTHLGLIPTNSFWQAPIADHEASYPVVLYSHGIGIGWAAANTVLVEGLASRGYIVIGIEHAFIGSLSIFPDGRTAPFDLATSAAMNQPPPQSVRDMQEQFRSSTDWQEQITLYQEAMSVIPGLSHVSTALDTQVADQKFVVDQLAQLRGERNIPFSDHLDLTRIGVMGMSLGGSAALESCATDTRFRAGVNLDGFHPRHIDLALEATPFLYVNRGDNLLFNTNFQSAKGPSYSALIAGVTHFNFFDFAIMSPLYQTLGILGSLDGLRGLHLVQDHVLAFFDAHLRGVDGNQIKAVAASYPEVTFSQRNESSSD